MTVRAHGAARGAGSSVAASGRLQMRRGQSLSMDRLGTNQIVRVERGCIVLQAPRVEGGSHVALLLFPGDVFSRDAAPPLNGMSLAAATAVTLSLSLPAPESPGRGEGGVSVAFARLVARTALHAITLNELTAEQRIATFLVDMALRFGNRTAAGCSFELPLSRTSMSHYLALNPDTLSRLMSRLKAQGLVTTPSRGRATIPSLARLAALSPLSGALRRYSPGSECGVALDPVGETAP
jgi:CRP/FNR family transcriptional regulator, anaerobic regulatory protein